jgi:outer membrane receptor protein involved in Fe transport
VGYTFRQTRNVGAARIRGIELGWQQQFTFLPGPRRGLGAFANYTYTQSSISVGADDLAPIPGAPTQLASQLFDDGAPLVGQSDHVANLSLGIEDTEKVQQFTVLFNYASERVTLRGGALPDVVEDPGLTVDIVARSEIQLGGLPLELSFEARNLFGRDNFEYQEVNGNRAELNTYEVGTSFSLGVKASF